MKRRDFLQIASGGAIGAAVPAAGVMASSLDSTESKRSSGGRLDLSEVPNFCSHEHWSTTTVRSPDGELAQGVTPPEPVDLRCFIRGAQDAESVEACRKYWSERRSRLGLSGTFQCIRRGIHALHGQDLARDEPEVWAAASASIAEAYKDLHGWTPKAMQKAHLSELVRTIVPQYYTQVASSVEAEKERQYTHTVLRLDPILAMLPKKGGSDDDAFFTETPDWWTSRHVRIRPKDVQQSLIEAAGIVPRDAAGWRTFLANLFDLVASGGCRGLKDMAAKMRPLDFQIRSDTEVRFRGVETFEEAAILQDWVWHECCKLAHDRNWPWQVHTGTTTLKDSSPLPLESCIKRYGRVKWVLLHCWPYLAETGFLARSYPNVWVDTCWLPLLNPHFYRQAIQEWIQYLPLGKIHCGHDAHSVEEAAGSSIITREILGEVLTEQWHASGLTEEEMMAIARDLLHNNAVRVYGVGKVAWK